MTRKKPSSSTAKFLHTTFFLEQPMWRNLSGVCLVVVALATPSIADELKVEHVRNAKGDGADGKGNTADDSWQFWFELAHQRGQFARLATYSTSIPKTGIPRKVRGPIASLLPNPDDTEGWIFHRDWDGRFEGFWGDAKASQLIAYPYVEKTSHCAVAVSYKVPKDGAYDITGGLTDLQVLPQFKQHDGVEWVLQLADDGKPGKTIGRGGPFGDGNGRPDSVTFQHRNVAAAKGQLIRLEIHPRKWWGSDMTRIDSFRIVPSREK